MKRQQILWLILIVLANLAHALGVLK